MLHKLESCDGRRSAATATTGDEREAYTVLRACFVNPLTTRADVDALAELTIHRARVVRCEGET
jgi:hypothetical protein